METTNKMVKKFSSSFLTTLAILAGMGVAFATWTGGNTEFAASDFHNGQAITPNMIAGNLMGYVRDASGNNIYWRKFDTTNRTLNQSASFCASKGMWLPSYDQSVFYTLNAGTYRGINTNGTVVNYSSVTNATSYHHTGQAYNTSHNCSTDGCAYYYISYPGGWTSGSQAYGYSTYQTLCVYKRWY